MKTHTTSTPHSLSFAFVATLFIVVGLFLVAPAKAEAAIVYSQLDSSSQYGVYTGGSGQAKSLGSNILASATSSSQVYISFSASGENGFAPVTVGLGPWFNCFSYDFTTGERNDMIANPGVFFNFDNRLMNYINDCSSATTTQFLTTVSFGGNTLESSIKSNSSFSPYLQVSVNSLNPPLDTQTRFVSFFPANGSTTATTSIAFAATIFYNGTEPNSPYMTVVCADVFNIEYQVRDIPFQPDNQRFCGDVAASGLSTVVLNPLGSPQLQEGLYSVDWFFTNPTDIENDVKFLYTTTEFIAVRSVTVRLEDSLNGATTTTAFLSFLSDCEEIAASSTFSWLNPQKTVCTTVTGTINGIRYLFIPNSAVITTSLNSFKANVITHFPIGYFTDFARIFSTSSTSTLTVVDATLPNVLPGGGTHIRLDLYRKLDWALNATSSIYNNSSASSTRTLGEITMDYWKIVIYVSAGLYVLARIAGRFFVPTGFGSHGSLSDNGSNDDSYRLKETLYKSSYRGRGGLGPFK